MDTLGLLGIRILDLYRHLSRWREEEGITSGFGIAESGSGISTVEVLGLRVVERCID